LNSKKVQRTQRIALRQTVHEDLIKCQEKPQYALQTGLKQLMLDVQRELVIGDRQTKSTVCIDTLNQKEFYDV
jgi:F0F1-type ATP synthase alpha subunit